MPVVMLLKQTQNSKVISKCTLMLLDITLHLITSSSCLHLMKLFNGFWTVVLLQ